MFILTNSNLGSLMKLVISKMEFDERFRQSHIYECLLFGNPFTQKLCFEKLIIEEILNGYFLSLLFSDLDDTLYPLSSGLATACRENIEGTEHYTSFIALSDVVQVVLFLIFAPLLSVFRLHG